MSEWFEDEAFWVETYPHMFPEERIEKAGEEVDKILHLVGVDRGAVLDLCCGPGRCAVELARRGFRVTGVDRTSFLLDKAKARSEENGLEIEWILQDMREFKRPGAFEFALSMFTSFGYFDDKDEDLLVLVNIYENLKQGGAVFMDMMGKERLARIFLATSSEQLPDGTLMVQRRQIFDDWSRIRNEWIIIRDGKTRSFTFHHTVYSGQELKDRLRQAGFNDVKLFGDLDGNEYGPDAKRLIAVARK